MKLSRRFFVGSVAGAATGAVTSNIALRATSELTALTSVPIRPPGGAEGFHAGICTECASGCGTRVRTIGERAVFVGGNPNSPLNRGGVCPRGVASIQEQYHPDRFQAPLQRAGKGNDLQPTDWSTAKGRVAAALSALRSDGVPARLAVMHEARNDPFDGLVDNFLRAFGSPNHLRIEALPPALRAAWALTQGATGPLAYDIERAGMVVGFSAGLLDGFGSPGYSQHAYGELRRRAQTGRGRWIQIEPRLSVTASRADEWVSLRAGTEGVLALGLAYVLLAERLYDQEFVESHVNGFEPYVDAEGVAQLGFRDWVLENFYVSRVSEQTDVPAETIIRLARQLPRYAPTVAVAGRAAALHENGVWNCWAIHCLNALLGSIGIEGGVLEPLSVPFDRGPVVVPDSVALSGLQSAPIGHELAAELPNGVAPDPVTALLSAGEGAPPLDVLVVVECDPIALSPDPGRLARILERIPLVVVISPHDSETAALADVVLPSPGCLERWEMVGNPPLTPYTVCGLRRPVVEPRGDTRHPGDVLIGLAQSLGEPLAAAVPWSDYEACLKASAVGLFEARRGDVFGPEFDANYTRLMQRAGLWTPAYGNAAELWDLMQERGGWWDPLTYTGERRRMLRTPTGRFDLSPRQEAEIWSSAPDRDFPLLLFPFETQAVAHGRFNDMPLLRTLSGPHFDGPMPAWVELHPETAEELGLHDGDVVVVESESGSVQARLRLYEGVKDGLAAMPLGFGRTRGRWANGWGANVLSLIATPELIHGGDVSQYNTRIRVRRA